jgi:hypothetical protein
MASSNDFRIIENRHVQSLMKVSPRTATRFLQETRDRFGKSAGFPVYLPEFCTYMKLDIVKVCAFFGWD